MAIGTYISIITLNVNGLSAPTKRYRLAEWIQKQYPYICCLQETHFRPQDTHRLKVRGCKNISHVPEPARDIPLVTKVVRKEARHMQRRDQALGVSPDILEHLPPKNQSLPTLLLCALTSDFTGGCPPPPSRSLCQRLNLQLQLIKFLGN